MHSFKKVYLLFFILISLAVIFIFFQLIKAKKISITPAEKPLLSSNLADIPLTETDPDPLGNPGAELTIVEFIDFSDSTNRAVHATIEEFVRANANKVRLFIKDSPGFSLIGDTSLPHRAAYCAQKQNKYWLFISAMLKDKNNLKLNGLNKLALELKINQTFFNDCIKSTTAQNKINESANLFKQLGLTDTPAIFINNKLLTLDKDLDLKQLLEQLMK